MVWFDVIDELWAEKISEYGSLSVSADDFDTAGEH